MKTTFTLIFSVFFVYLNSQTNLYWFKKDIENTFVNDSAKDKSYRSQMGATYYSISNNFKNALQTWDKNFSREKKYDGKVMVNFAKYKPLNAKKEILKRAEKEQIIILNEAHHNASHRNFATSLLKGLYDKGYRYLGVETLKDDDSLEIRKFAVQSSGFYSKEPQFGLFLKEALSLGFKVFTYESSKGNGKDREIGQAKNIFDFMTNNQNGKMLIYCGYEHAFEGVHKSWEKTMAERLKNLTGINPFTIDQTQFSEKSQEKFTEPLLKFVNKKYPTILINNKGELFNGDNKEFYTDAIIIGSYSTYKNGKPNWMLTKGKKYFVIPKIQNPVPALVFAYKDGEYKMNGIPEDITEIENWNDSNYLILGKGNYDIIYLDKNYEIIKSLKIKGK